MMTMNDPLDAQEEALARANKAARRRNLAILALAVLMTIFGIVCFFLAMDNARLAAVNATYGQTQQQEKQSLAEEFDAACKSDDFQTTPAGTTICQKAEQVASEPANALAGPQGIQGLQGVPGPRGEQGFPGPMGPAGVKGDKGDVGAQGIAGLLGLAGAKGADGPMGPVGPAGPMGPIGPVGATGATGADGAPGPAGADSTIPGPQGATGPEGPQGPAGAPGSDGRGIKDAYCWDNGRWTITYTDGTTSDGGMCRATLTPPGQGTP